MSLDEIRYKGKPVERDKGFTGTITTVAVAIEHNADGSVTVCKEIADEIYKTRRVPKRIRNYFKPTQFLISMISDKFEEFK